MKQKGSFLTKWDAFYIKSSRKAPTSALANYLYLLHRLNQSEPFSRLQPFKTFSSKDVTSTTPTYLKKLTCPSQWRSLLIHPAIFSLKAMTVILLNHYMAQKELENFGKMQSIRNFWKLTVLTMLRRSLSVLLLLWRKIEHNICLVVDDFALCPYSTTWSPNSRLNWQRLLMLRFTEYWNLSYDGKSHTLQQWYKSFNNLITNDCSVDSKWKTAISYDFHCRQMPILALYIVMSCVYQRNGTYIQSFSRKYILSCTMHTSRSIFFYLH